MPVVLVTACCCAIDLDAQRAVAGVSRDMRGRQIVAIRGHPQKLEVSRSYVGLFKGM